MKPLKSQKILVTGGAGFIGSRLVGHLLAMKDVAVQVTCVENFDPFYDPKIKAENIRGALTHPNFSLTKTDICDKPGLENIFRQIRPNIVVHLAARAGVRPSIANPIAYHQTNVEGTLNVLECSRDHGVKRLVFGSSSSVYGVSSRLPFDEDDPLLCPISPYAVSKIAAESLCRVFHRLHGISIACLRFFTAYGPRQRPEMAIAKFARQLLNGETIDMYGDGGSLRDYTYVDDIVDGIIAAMTRPLGFEVINIGNAGAVPLRKLLSVLESQSKIKARIRRMPSQAGDVPVTFASLAKAKRILHYKPRVSIIEGIGRYWEWMNASRQENSMVPSK